MKQILLGSALLGASLLWSPSVLPQSPPSEDGCVDVLFYSARNVSIESAEIGTSLRIYDQYCENSEVRSSSSTSAGIDTVIKAVPVKFNLNSGSTEERLKYFCRTFDSEYKKNEKYYRQTSEVSSDTTNAWLACKSLASKGVLFRPKVGSTLVTIEVARQGAANQSVEGITYDTSLLACSAPNTDGSRSRVTVDDRTTKALSDKFWVVTCKRIPKMNGSEARFPKTEITIGTTQGSFLLPIAADARLPFEFASDFQRQLDKFNNGLTATTGEVGQQRAAIEKLQTKIVTQSGQTYKPGPGDLRINFPAPFKQAPVVIVSPVWQSGGVGYTDTVKSVDTTGFIVTSNNAAYHVNWIARGE